LQQGCARALLSLLDLRGGCPCRALRGNVLLKGSGGLAGTGTSSVAVGTGRGDEGPASPTTLSAASTNIASAVDATASAG
jgi:hypothetical protein